MEGIGDYTEKELLIMLSKGNEQAFTTLFYNYKNKLYSFLLHFTGSSSIAEDVLQEIFLKVWKNRQMFSEIENFSAYLYKMAQNDAINGLKRQSRSHFILAKIDGSKSITQSNEDILAAKEVTELMQQAVNRLPAQQRRVYELSRNAGLTYDQIAEQLHISASTVRNHMVQALKTIREFLLRYYPLGIICCILFSYPQNIFFSFALDLIPFSIVIEVSFTIV